MPAFRTAELLGALSLGTDLSTGFPPETALRTALCAVRCANVMGLGPEIVKAAYFAGVTRFLGCTAVAHEVGRLNGGDDIGFLTLYGDVDFGSSLAVARRAVTGLARSETLLARGRAVGSFLSNPRVGEEVSAAHCALAAALSGELCLGELVGEALLQMYERWDGRGAPGKRRGDAITITARVLHIAHVSEVFARVHGHQAARAEIARRASGHFDPALARAVLSQYDEVASGLFEPSVWDAYLEAEPLPWKTEDEARRTDVARAFAMFVDLKSPYTLAHSTTVAAVASSALRQTGASTEACVELEAAALLHDLGRAGVPNGIWDKPGKLNPAEWERARGHAHATERVLTQSALLRPLAELAAADHERCDGGGYPRRAPRLLLSLASRILAASDVFVALQETRAYRPSRSERQAAEVLRDEVKAGRLCPTAVEAVLSTLDGGERVVRAHPNQLTEREVAVLVLVAEGLTNKEVAVTLSISPRTVQTHLAHVFDKTGARTRAALATFAVLNGVARRPVPGDS